MGFLQNETPGGSSKISYNNRVVSLIKNLCIPFHKSFWWTQLCHISDQILINLIFHREKGCRLFFNNKQWAYTRHLLHPSFGITHLIYLILIFLTFVLCKSLTFGQTRLFSPDRTVFRTERRLLPILWYDLPKIEAKSQVRCSPTC